MSREQVRRLPVIDGHQLVGMVSQADLARRLSNRRSGRMLAEVSKPPASRWRRLWMVPLLLGAGALLYRPLRKMRSARNSVTADTIVRVPVHAAYDQWTQFEEFPTFMSDIEEVRQVDDTHLHWRARVAGKAREWDARIDDQEPDRKISWHSTSGARNDGTVLFEPVDPNSTRVKVEMAFEPDSMSRAARIGDRPALASREGRPRAVPRADREARRRADRRLARHGLSSRSRTTDPRRRVSRPRRAAPAPAPAPCRGSCSRCRRTGRSCGRPRSAARCRRRATRGAPASRADTVASAGGATARLASQTSQFPQGAGNGSPK